MPQANKISEEELEAQQQALLYYEEQKKFI